MYVFDHEQWNAEYWDYPPYGSADVAFISLRGRVEKKTYYSAAYLDNPIGGHDETPTVMPPAIEREAIELMKWVKANTNEPIWPALRSLEDNELAGPDYYEP